MSETRPLQPARHTDNQAASSANPDTERMPAWDDEGWDAYLWAVDPDDRMIEEDDWTDADEEEYIAGDWADDEIDEIDEIEAGLEQDEADMARIAREWAAYDRDPPGS